jgi:hypothetical protein
LLAFFFDFLMEFAVPVGLRDRPLRPSFAGFCSALLLLDFLLLRLKQCWSVCLACQQLVIVTG